MTIKEELGKVEWRLTKRIGLLEAKIKELDGIKAIIARVSVLETARNEQRKINGELLAKKPKPVEDVKSFWDIFRR